MSTIAKRLILTGAVAVLGASCTDVTVEPKSTISSANVFSEPGAYRQFLAKVYAGLAVTGQSGPDGSADISTNDEGFSNYVRLWWQMNELPTDEAAIAWGDAGVQELNTQLWGPANSFLSMMYYRVYFQVGMANEFLRETTDEKLAERNVSAELRTQIKQMRAEARFLRALSLWHGIDLFGDIPLVTDASALGKTPPQQARRADVFNFIVNDLTSARTDLPAAGTGEYGRADQGAVAMLLAKLYLNAAVYTGTARYADARAEAERVIAGTYTLDANFRRIFSADNHTSREIVFPVTQDGERTRTWGGTTFLINASIGNQMNAADYGVGGGWWGLRLKPNIVALFPGNGGPSSVDRRSSHFVSGGQSLAMNNLTDFSNGFAGPKFTNKTSAGVAGSNNTHPDTDYPMFRLADAYLIYAEAVVRGGGGTRAQALAYINALRARAYGNANGNITDAEMTADFLLDERARELLWEGTRRTDLIRYGRFTSSGTWAWKGNVLNGRTTDAFRNLYPLPSSELLANPNLKQNTGY
jgi:hypothetical protein